MLSAGHSSANLVSSAPKHLDDSATRAGEPFEPGHQMFSAPSATSAIKYAGEAAAFPGGASV
jgi:hypothetical protein